MDTRTKITVAFIVAFSSSTATAIQLPEDFQTSATEVVIAQKSNGTNAFSTQDDIKYERRKKSYRDRYKRLGESEWFNKHYNNKSLGEVAEIVD